MFKSQLQEYAQKAALPPPVYEFVKEGAPHEPRFKASVNINGVSYESAPGYPNLKSAEHAAAKVALEQLVQTRGCGGGGGKVTPAPVHESGLCKNLLQEYAQKSSLPLPVYRSIRSGEDHSPSFSATVEVAGVKYSGGFAKSKKEAEIKAARTALLAIQTQAPHVGPRPLGSGQGQTSSALVLSGSVKKRYRQASEPADDSVRGRKEQRLIIPVPAANKGLGSEKLLEKQLDSGQNLDARIDGGQDEEGLLPGDSSQPFSQEMSGPEAGSSQESCLTQEQQVVKIDAFAQKMSYAVPMLSGPVSLRSLLPLHVQAPNNPSVSGLRQVPAISPAVRGSYSYTYPGYLPSTEAHLHGRRYSGPQHIFSSQQDLPEYSFPDSEGYGHSIIHDYVRTAELAGLVPQIQPRLHEVHSNQQEGRQTSPQMQGTE